MRSELCRPLPIPPFPGKGGPLNLNSQHAGRELIKRARTAFEQRSGQAKAKSHLSAWHASAGGALVVVGGWAV